MHGAQDITSAYALLALQDYYSGNSTWNNTVTNGIQAYNKQYGLYNNPDQLVTNSDAIYWGIVFYYAYRTYRQPFLLNLAVEAYNATYLYGFVTPQDAASGTGAGRNGSFLPLPGCTNGERSIR